nr:hypothetical protein [Klebsiella pneumoniae]
MTEILRVLQEGLVMHGQHYARKSTWPGQIRLRHEIFHPERPHESLNNLTPEDHLLMAEKPELSKVRGTKTGVHYSTSC